MRGFGRFWNPAYAGAAAGCGPWREAAHTGHGRGPEFASYSWGGHADGGHFGVRRPLRFLAFKLGLREEQIAALARILDELKTERAQAAVDDRRVLSAFADAVGSGSFDETRANEAVALRRASGDRSCNHR